MIICPGKDVKLYIIDVRLDNQNVFFCTPINFNITS